ncbi:MAG TPA: thymidine kinase [Candidatus Azoamicus sp.]
MAKLYYFTSTMNAGKTTQLLQFNYNCIKRNINTLIFTATLKNKKNCIKSRLGLKNLALPLTNNINIYKYVEKYKHMIKYIFIDEVQFLTKKQIFEIITIVDKLKINIITYGLKTDFKMKLFTASKYLISLSDKIFEIETLCKCGKKAIANARINKFGKKITHGKQIKLNKKIYIPTCRYHYFNFFDKKMR